MQACGQFFKWCDDCGLSLANLTPVVVASYIEQHQASAPTVKQHLAAIKMLFDYLVTGGVLHTNPASSVKGPKYVIKKGKTPVLSAEDTRLLLDSIDTTNISGKRDKALISLMVFSFARVSAVINLKVHDYYP